MQFIDAESVRSVGFDTLIQSLREEHAKLPAVAKDMFLFEDSATGGQPNCLLNRAAWNHGQSLGVKLATVFPANSDPSVGLPTTQAVFILFDGTNGKPTAVIDGKSLTNLKTAADSALGASYLAREDAKVLLMIGAGSVAPDLVCAHLTARPGITDVLLWNRTASKAYALQERLERNDLLANVNFHVAYELASAVSTADIVSCATASASPILQGKLLKPGTHVDLVGGYTPKMREADDDVIKRGSIFVDSRRTTIGDVGDIKTPIEQGILTVDAIRADLYDLGSGRHPGRSNQQEITVFKNGGGGHLDLMTAEAIVRTLRKN